MSPVDTELDIQELDKESTALIVRAEKFEIVSDDVYVKAMMFAKDIKGLMKEVRSAFDPIVAKANAAWKEAIAQRDKRLTPLEAALQMIDKKGRAFRFEQEKLRQEEERKARELAVKEAEKLAKRAEKAQAKGNEEKAQELTAKAQEVASITPVIQSKVSQVEGIKVRKVWKFKIVDLKALPREYLIPNEPMLGQLARATKGTLQVPGVEFYSEDSSI